MIVTIDGPAGAGKSTSARELAQRLGFQFLDTGAMYRAVALAAMNAHLDWNDYAALETLAAAVRIQIEGDRTLLNGVDVSQQIRTPEVTAATQHVADHPGVRANLVELQRSIACGRDIVTEGRDQGTVVFPQAECKIFLTATPEERARRRALQLGGGGEASDWQRILAEQTNRDRRDEMRKIGGLQKAADAIELNGDGLTKQEVVDRLEQLVRAAIEKVQR